MVEPAANVRLSLAATAENVVLVREMLAGVADGVGLDPTHLHDIHTARHRGMQQRRVACLRQA